MRHVCEVEHVRSVPFPRQAASLTLLATLSTVARLQPVAAWIWDHDAPLLSIDAIALFRAVSSGRPL